MSQNNPESSEASPVFFARGDRIHNGFEDGQSGTHVYVKTIGRDGVHTTQMHHKSEIFSSLDLLNMGEDLVQPIIPGEEVSVDQVVNELTTRPEHARELAIRMGAEAMIRFMTVERTPRELGIRSVEELIGSEDETGSNAWKIQELVDGIARGGYGAGFSNTLEVARLSPEADLLPTDRRAELKSEIVDINREMLDRLYEKNAVDVTSAKVYEKNDGKFREVITVYPAREGVISFVEKIIYNSSDPSPLPKDSRGFRVDVHVRAPAYTEEKGYTPIVY